MFPPFSRDSVWWPSRRANWIAKCVGVMLFALPMLVQAQGQRAEQLRIETQEEVQAHTQNPDQDSTHSEPLAVISTGGVTGVYYAAGGALCRVVAKGEAARDQVCKVEPSGGSVFNINALESAESKVNFAIAQADVASNAYKGEQQFQHVGPKPDLRFVMGLYPEVFTLVTQADNPVHALADFAGQRFNLGTAGSGQRKATEEVLHAYGFPKDFFARTYELRADEQGRALCEDRVDGFLYVVGHPAANIQDVSSSCQARLLPLSDHTTAELIAQHPYYTKASIPAGLYAGQDQDIDSMAIWATLLTTASTSDEAVYQLLQGVFDHFDDYRRLHPAFAKLDPQAMAQASPGIPLHPGAARYYRERGWLK